MNQSLSISPTTLKSCPTIMAAKDRNRVLKIMVSRDDLLASSCCSMVKASTNVLARSSPFFRALLSNGMKETREKEICLEVSDDVVAKLLADGIEYLHTRHLKLDAIPVHDQLQLLALSDQFLCMFLVCFFSNRCMRFFVSTVSDLEASCMTNLVAKIDQECVEILSHFQTSVPLPFVDIVVKSKEALVKAFQEFDVTWQTDRFLTLPHFGVRMLLETQQLQVESENTVYQALRHWWQANRTQRSLTAQDALALLRCVRWRRLSFHFLVDVVKSDTTFITPSDYKEKLEWTDWIMDAICFTASSPTRKSLVSCRLPVGTRQEPRPGFLTTPTRRIELTCTTRALTGSLPVCSDIILVAGYAIQACVQRDIVGCLGKCGGFIQILRRTGFTSSLFVQLERSVRVQRRDTLGWETLTPSQSETFTEPRRAWAVADLFASTMGGSYTVERLTADNCPYVFVDGSIHFAWNCRLLEF